MSQNRTVIVFDYDGTLVDTYSIKRESYWQAVRDVLGLRDEDRAVVDASYARTSGAHRFEQLVDTARALERGFTVEQRDEFSRRYSAYNDAAKDRMREFPSVHAVLVSLRGAHDLVLLSGLPHDLLLAEAESRGLAGFFVRIEGGDKGRSLDRLRSEGRKIVLFVGDTPHDESVATARGIPFFRVQRDEDLSSVPEALASVSRQHRKV